MVQRLAFTVLVSMVLSAAPALAQCQKTCEKAATCQSKDSGQGCAHGQDGCSAKAASGEHEKTKGAMCNSDVTCDGDVVRFEGVDLPRIGFKVDGTLTCCMKSAKSMAGDDLSKIHFVVGEKTYPNLPEAKAARLVLLEQYYDSLLAVKFAVGDECTACPMTAKDICKKSGKPVRYRLASYEFAEKSDAEKAVELARAAAEKVSMDWVVGEKKYHCPTEAAAAAKANGGKIEYCVGDQKTPCETTGKTRLVEARITAALQALAQAAQG